MYKNGYVIKGLFDSQYTRPLFQSAENYRGVGRYVSWPLDDYEDPSSIRISKELFLYQNPGPYSLSFTVPKKKLLEEYTALCLDHGIKTTVLMIESSYEDPLIDDELPIVEFLGYDCIESGSFSYWYDEMRVFIDKLTALNVGLNENALFENIADAKKYIDLRNIAISDGLDFEHGEPIIAKVYHVSL